MKLVVGLGNPGRKYVGTRHNVGFDVLRQFARRFPAEGPRTKFEAQIVEIVDGEERLLLAAPQTFMNLSGRSVRQIVGFYKLSTAALLVVCDDMNLDLGRLRMRRSGSAGGQKGLRSIIDELGTEEFARLRIGIGRPPGRMDPTDYVLSRYSQAEQEEMAVAHERAADAVLLWTRGGVDSAMNRINAPPATQSDPAQDEPIPGRD